jgi:hypothetical protein
MRYLKALDVPGRLRLRCRPEDLGPDAFLALSARLMGIPGVRSVEFSRLTGGLLVLYGRGGSIKADVLEAVEAFDTGTPVPVSFLERPLLRATGEGPPGAEGGAGGLGPIPGALLRKLLLPKGVGMIWDALGGFRVSIDDVYEYRFCCRGKDAHDLAAHAIKELFKK